MWILIVLAAHGGTSITQSDLRSCEASADLVVRMQEHPDDIRDAYCKSPFGDVVWIVKDSKRLADLLCDPQ